MMSFTPRQVQKNETERSHALDRWQERAVFAMLGMITLSFVMSNLWAMWWQKSDWLVAAVLPAVVVNLTNETRVETDVAALTRNPVLDQAAQMKAEHMVENGYFAHYSPTGVTPWQWFAEVGYDYDSAGENLAVHFTDSQAVVEAWLDSPSHRENIVNSAFTEIGVGTAKGRYQGYDTVFVVQLFATPEASRSAEREADTVAVSPEDVLPATATSTQNNVESTVAGISTAEARTDLEVGTSSAGYQVIDLESGSAEQVAQWSSYTATTSTGEASVPQTAEPATTATGGSTIGVLATQPNTILQWVYIVLSLITVGILLWALQIEIRQRRLLQVGYSIGLLCLMVGMWYVHTLITGSVLIG